MQELLQTPVEQPHAAPSFTVPSYAAPSYDAPTHATPDPLEETFDVAPSVEVEKSAPIRDEIAKLVQNLFLLPQGPRRVVFSGTESGSGSSWMCARAAEGLAPQGRGSVCVVDCNLRSPGLHRQFHAKNQHGLSDALLGSGSIREYTQKLSRNLWLLSSGSMAEAGLTMLGSDRMRSRLAELRSAFDYVLIDAAPLNGWNDAIVLGGLSDGVVLTLKANSSRREAARKIVQELQAANVRVLGAVLNQRTFPIPEALYKKL